MGGIKQKMNAAKKYAIDPALSKYAINMPFSAPILRAARPAMRAMYAATAIDRSVVHRNVTTNGLRIDIFEPRVSHEKTPCILYLHGGGFGYMAAPYHKQAAADYAIGAECRVICPDYRLLPRHPYPAARDDTVVALRWIKETYPAAPIGIGGDSAGAALAATAALTAEAFDLCFLMLIYPVCDDSCSTTSMAAFDDTPLWNSKNNTVMWQMYLGGRQGDPETAQAVPCRCEILSDPPPTYIELCEFDCLHDEGVDFAERLKKHGGTVEINDTRGTFHGYDIARGAEITQICMARRIDFIKRCFIN